MDSDVHDELLLTIKYHNVIQLSTKHVIYSQDMDWAGIKSSFQAMYKKALPQVQLFQFLTKKLTYIDLDRDSKMYKLSDFLTKNMVDSMHWAFRWTPLGGY